MDINASDIYSFYQSKLGTLVKRNIRHQLYSHFNSINDSVVCGYGYTNWGNKYTLGFCIRNRMLSKSS